MELLGEFEAALRAEVDVDQRYVGPYFLEQPQRLGSGGRHANYRQAFTFQQATRGVIDAVAVRVQWHHAVGVLEQADVIGQPLQVTEWRVGAPHRTEAVAPGPPTEPAPAEDMGDGDDPELIRESTAERFRKNLNAHQRRT